MDRKDITGIVLAGGKSSRMGTDKSFMLYNGKPLIQHAIDVIKPLCNRVVISSNKNVYEFTECEVWPDLFDIQAPIVGIYSCLKRSTTNINIVLSCDMPLIQTSLFTNLLAVSETSDIVVPIHDNFMEPLSGIYKRTLIPALEETIAGNRYKMHSFIQMNSFYALEIKPSHGFYNSNMFLNINTITDFNNLITP